MLYGQLFITEDDKKKSKKKKRKGNKSMLVVYIMDVFWKFVVDNYLFVYVCVHVYMCKHLSV